MRDIKALHPRLQEKVALLVKECEKQGISILFSECLRTVAEQDALYAQGRTKPGNIVTNAKGSTYSSQHQWGIAIDFYINMDIDGDGDKKDDAFNDSTGLFSKVGAIAKSIGLGWGGDWVSIKDKPHLYLSDWGSTTSKLKQQYGTPEKFMQTWSSINVSNSNPVTNTTVTTKKKVFNQHVHDLQWAMNQDGFTDAQGRRLEEDGLWGNNSNSAAVKILLSTKTLGRYTNVTSWVQCRVGAGVDGLYGQDTANHVKTFQSSCGLVADGITGKNTIISLVKKYAPEAF